MMGREVLRQSMEGYDLKPVLLAVGLGDGAVIEAEEVVDNSGRTRP